MSVDTIADSEPQADAKPKRHRRRKSKPGLSLMAQGEPLVWLTGGALVLCVTMIIGLLALVLYWGTFTFWPLPLVRVELADGTIRMGEVTRGESYTISSDVVGNMNPELAAAANRLLNGQDSGESKRRLFRTGNFELTNEDFNWVSEFEIKEGSESEPTWGVVLERIEWGRFYGEPKEFALRHLRDVAASEAAVADLVRFFDANRWRLQPDDFAKFDEAIAPIKAELNSARSKGVADFLTGFRGASGMREEAKLDDNQVVAIADLATENNVVEFVQVWEGSEAAWNKFQEFHHEVRSRYRERRSLEKHEIGKVNRELEEARLDLKLVELDNETPIVQQATELASLGFAINSIEQARRETSELVAAITKRYQTKPEVIEFARQLQMAADADIEQQLQGPTARREELRAEVAQMPEAVRTEVEHFLQVNHVAVEATAEIQLEIDKLNAKNDRYQLRLVTADGIDKTHALSEIVRAYVPNQLTFGGKARVYFSRWGEFLADDPRSANTEGGVFPAIWGTVAMTLIMSLFVVPFGVLAALYLREYAKAGIVVSAVRIAINNLAGVPSIVFGVFGLGFFCYFLGAYIDGGPDRAKISPWPASSWFTMLAGLVVTAVAAFVIGISGSRAHPTSSSSWKRLASRMSLALWVIATVLVVLLLFTTPFFDGFYRAHGNNPKFGKGGLLWASLTLSLLTLPVVIVATEEALSAVPNSLREGSYGCGASKWQTIWRIVLPHAAPGIMTGMILAMARGAGEVAPLMLVGALKFVPELPVDGLFPFIHPDRSFMHLGFHIYDLGFQSRNSEAAKPMVFTTTLLLITLIACLNISAVALRARLRKRFGSGQF